MSQPPVVPGPPQPQPPLSYGGYGGDLQHYQPHRPPPGEPQSRPQPALPASPAPPAPLPPQQPWFPASAAAIPYGQLPRPPQRPAVVGLASTLAVTASLQFVGALSFFWLLAATSDQALGTAGPDGVLFHILNRFNLRMLNGLAWPLYLFPVASIVLGLLLPTRRRGVRLAFSLLAGLAVVWLAWLFRSDLRWLIVPGLYIALSAGITWTAAATRWFRWRPDQGEPPQPLPQPSPVADGRAFHR